MIASANPTPGNPMANCHRKSAAKLKSKSNFINPADGIPIWIGSMHVEMKRNQKNSKVKGEETHRYCWTSFLMLPLGLMKGKAVLRSRLVAMATLISGLQPPHTPHTLAHSTGTHTHIDTHTHTHTHTLTHTHTRRGHLTSRSIE